MRIEGFALSFEFHSVGRASVSGGLDSLAVEEAARIRHIMLVFAGRRPSIGMLRGLCKIASISGARFTVARVWTVFSLLASLIGKSTARSDLELISQITQEMGITCDTVIWRDKTYPAGIIRLTHKLTPDLICVVPAAIGNGKATWRAISIAGGAVKGMLVIDQLQYGK